MLTMRIFLFLIIISKHLSAQEPEVGKVKADKNFSCSGYTFIDPLYGLGTFIDSLYNISNICNSRNKIEIRFTTSYAPTQLFDIITLTYNNGWQGKKYQFNTDTVYHDSVLNANANKIVITDFKPGYGLDSFFEMLKANDIFSLPNLNEIKKKPHGPTCGIIHALTFKVDDHYRTYTFSNTEYYVKHSKNSLFRSYHNIVNLFSEVKKE